MQNVINNTGPTSRKKRQILPADIRFATLRITRHIHEKEETIES